MESANLLHLLNQGLPLENSTVYIRYDFRRFTLEIRYETMRTLEPTPAVSRGFDALGIKFRSKKSYPILLDKEEKVEAEPAIAQIVTVETHSFDIKKDTRSLGSLVKTLWQKYKVSFSFCGLNWDKITSREALLILAMLPFSRSVTNVDKDCFTKEFAHSMAELLKSEKIIHLEMVDCTGFEDDVFVAIIAPAIGANQTLTKLLLPSLKIFPAGARALASALENNTKLTYLQFGESHFLDQLEICEVPSTEKAVARVVAPSFLQRMFKPFGGWSETILREGFENFFKIIAYLERNHDIEYAYKMIKEAEDFLILWIKDRLDSGNNYEIEIEKCYSLAIKFLDNMGKHLNINEIKKLRDSIYSSLGKTFLEYGKFAEAWVNLRKVEIWSDDIYWKLAEACRGEDPASYFINETANKNYYQLLLIFIKKSKKIDENLVARYFRLMQQGYAAKGLNADIKELTGCNRVVTFEQLLQAADLVKEKLPVSLKTALTQVLEQKQSSEPLFKYDPYLAQELANNSEICTVLGVNKVAILECMILQPELFPAKAQQTQNAQLLGHDDLAKLESNLFQMMNNSCDSQFSGEEGLAYQDQLSPLTNAQDTKISDRLLKQISAVGCLLGINYCQKRSQVIDLIRMNLAEITDIKDLQKIYVDLANIDDSFLNYSFQPMPKLISTIHRLLSEKALEMAKTDNTIQSNYQYYKFIFELPYPHFYLDSLNAMYEREFMKEFVDFYSSKGSEMLSETQENSWFSWIKIKM